MRVVVITHEGAPPEQYAALLAGVDVELTSEQVAGFVPPSRRPANLGEHPIWLLRGYDELVPAYVR